jgi:hypothetical protein
MHEVSWHGIIPLLHRSAAASFEGSTLLSRLLFCAPSTNTVPLLSVSFYNPSARVTQKTLSSLVKDACLLVHLGSLGHRPTQNYASRPSTNLK